MNFQRMLLLAALSLILLMMWQTWELEHNPDTKTIINNNISRQSTNSSITNINTTTNGNSIPSITDNNAQNITLTPTNNSRNNTVPSPENNTKQQVLFTKNNPYHNDILIKTDVFNIAINKIGGTIVELTLSQYPVDIEHKNQPFSLLQHQTEPFYIFESGIKGAPGFDKKLFPAHNVAVFESKQNQYVLTENTLKVPLFWEAENIKIIKTYVFTKGSYRIAVNYQIFNNSNTVWKGGVYGQLQRQGLLENEKRGIGNSSYTGGVYHTEEEAYQKVSFDDLLEKNLNITNANKSWVGFVQHYFTGAVVPANKNAHIYSYHSQNKFVIGALMPTTVVNPNNTKTVKFDLFLGPKLQDQMEQTRSGLELTADYGWLTVIAQPIFWLLKFIHGFVFNWGVAIILVTMVIKLIFFKLSATSYKSMAKMRKVHPRMTAIKERYANDKQKLNKAMTKLYREEKINPVGGCLPILVQMPVFIALYWVLLESVELRQASFLWLTDLSIKDPFFILPLVMGGSMFLQQKLNPKPTDPVQAKIMPLLPVIFTIFFAFFPSGLVLYWTVNNILSILQQWAITKKYDA